MHKQKVSTNIIKKIAYLSIITVLIGSFAVGIVKQSMVFADRFEDQINILNQDNSNKQVTKQQLGSEASSLADTINKLQADINAMQARIDADQVRADELQRQIVAAETELAKQRKLLGENIKAMYVEGQISTIEMLASSKDLSDFVDKQEYRNIVKDKIKASVDKVTELKHELKGKKEELDKNIKEQQGIKSQQDVQRAESARLLGLNQGEQSALNSQISQNYSKISSLRSQQAIENAKLFIGGIPKGIPGGGGYPGAWAFAPIDSIIDSWGMYNRECVSYTAWKVASTGRYMPYWDGIGNANQWDDNARRSGIPVDNNPRPGDVGISNSGYYGHAVYVEAVHDDGTITISQYNAGWDGYYSVARVNTSRFVYIHF